MNKLLSTLYTFEPRENRQGRRTREGEEGGGDNAWLRSHALRIITDQL